LLIFMLTHAILYCKQNERVCIIILGYLITILGIDIYFIYLYIQENSMQSAKELIT